MTKRMPKVQARTGLRTFSHLNFVIPFVILSFLFPMAAHCQQRAWSVGVARVDITPEYPVRLSGYGGRRTVSEGVAQKLWAKALAIGSDQEKPVLWITVDNCGLSAEICNEVSRRLL